MLTKADAKLVHALQSRRGRDKHGLFLAEGIRVVEDLLASAIDLQFALVSTTLGDTARGRTLIAALQDATTVKEVTERELSDVAETESPQGVLAVAHVRETPLAEVRLPGDAIILVLDAVQDPGNLGTLIRSADAFGAAAVVALPGTADYWSSKVIRSTVGAAFRIPLVTAREDEVWAWLEQNNVAICGADMEGKPIASINSSGRVAIVVGNEGAGLREQTRAQLTDLVSIPMRGHAESLNVAVAAGILLYEFSKRQQ
jgi:RNA methyltransferase, TrmH family